MFEIDRTILTCLNFQILENSKTDGPNYRKASLSRNSMIVITIFITSGYAPMEGGGGVVPCPNPHVLLFLVKKYFFLEG